MDAAEMLYFPRWNGLAAPFDKALRALKAVDSKSLAATQSFVLQLLTPYKRPFKLLRWRPK
jgi:hypothetical protein